MVAINKEQQQAGVVKDAVCAKCFRHIQYPQIVSKGTDRYGRTIRTYFGWCFGCHIGCEVIQFERDGRWVIHKYQNYAVKDGSHSQLSNKWTVLNELPESAAVVLGPGGDYDKQINPEDISFKPILKNILAALKATTKTVECLLEIIIDKKSG